MDLLQPYSGQEAATIDISKEAAACANWPTRERLRARKRIIPRADIEGVLQRTGKDRTHCRRLPAWFLVWFVIALSLFCRDCYRQVFRWLQPYRKGGTPGRTTLCEARKRLGVAPMRLLTEQGLFRSKVRGRGFPWGLARPPSGVINPARKILTLGSVLALQHTR